MRLLLPPHTRSLLLRLGSVLLVLMAVRALFWWKYQGAFPAVNVRDALMLLGQGLRFDAMTVVIANAPLILLHLLPVPWRSRGWYQALLSTLFLVVNGLLLFICCADLPFYGFNGKRITRDVLGQAGAGLRGSPGFLWRYAWATCAFVGGVLVLFVIGRRTRPRPAEVPWKWELSGTALLLALLVLIARGGLQYQGLSPAHAADHVPQGCAPLVTNSAFTLGYSLTEPVLPIPRWFSPEDLDRLRPLAYSIHRDSTDRRSNVVLLIVESLGREYLSSISGEPGYMPFLDSLCAHSLVLSEAFANAERSNKSMCAILAGIPSFTEDAFMNTAFAGNEVEGLGARLNEIGYTTAFYHGGLNGEYKFDSFSKACGFDRYVGKDEFADEGAYDGHWGIYDEEFLGFTATGLGQLQQPFCAAVFTLSSHDPFPIPARWKGRFPKGTQDIHESLGYADMSIRKFFGTASTQPWYANTVFVITGDHTYQYNDHPLWYRNPAGRFAVPIVFFSPDGRFTGRDTRTAQHLDILPSILDLVGYEGTVNTFGQSVFKRDRPDHALIHLGGEYRWVDNDRMLLFNGRRANGLFDHHGDTLFARDLSGAEPMGWAHRERAMKASIQRYAEAMRTNGLREH